MIVPSQEGQNPAYRPPDIFISPQVWYARAMNEPAAVFSRRQTVAQTDLDGFGHVNNGRYVDWANEIAWAHSEALGLSIDDYHRLGVGCVVWRHEFDYLAPLLLGDEIIIETWIAENDRRLTLTRAYRITRLADGREAFRGKTKFVSINMKTGRPARAPDEFVRAYAPFEGDR
jgi:acyl-CoA thioester hydrolase